MHAFVYPRPAHHKMYLEAKTEGGVSREDCNIEVIVRVSVGERWLNLHQRAHQQNLDATLIEDNRGREPRERKDLSLPHTPSTKTRTHYPPCAHIVRTGLIPGTESAFCSHHPRGPLPAAHLHSLHSQLASIREHSRSPQQVCLQRAIPPVPDESE